MVDLIYLHFIGVCSRKKRRSQDNIQAVIQRNARLRKLDIKKNTSLPADQANAHGR